MLSRSGSCPSSLTRRLRNASSCCAFTSAAEARRRIGPTRRVRSMRSPTISSYSRWLTVRPTSPASSSQITRRSRTLLRHSASAVIRRNGRKIVSSSKELLAKASTNPMSGGSDTAGGSPAAIAASAATSGSALLTICAAIDLLRDRRGSRRRQQHRRVRPQDLPHNRMPHNPGVDKLEKGAVERQGERGGDAPAPEEACGEQPRRLAFPSLKEPQQAERH